MDSKELLERIEQGILDCSQSDVFRSYLKTMSNFHSYSFNNALLIAMQCPHATLVAGYQTWQKKLNRHVKQGEKGIKIFAPCFKSKDARKDEDEPEIYGFRVTTVFDVSQTDGEPLPTLCQDLTKDLVEFETLKEKWSAVAKIPVSFIESDKSAHGWYSPADNAITIRANQGELQQIKTLIHEIAHSRLHTKDAEPKLSRDAEEVEAESVAFIVCEHFGMDTSNYSFAYLASWSNLDLSILKKSFSRILKTASQLIKEYESLEAIE